MSYDINNDLYPMEYKKPKGGTRKIKEPPGMIPCNHPQHNPPSHMVFEPGLYEHTCPACGATMQFRVDRITM